MNSQIKPRKKIMLTGYSQVILTAVNKSHLRYIIMFGLIFLISQSTFLHGETEVRKKLEGRK